MLAKDARLNPARSCGAAGSFQELNRFQRMLKLAIDSRGKIGIMSINNLVRKAQPLTADGSERQLPLGLSSFCQLLYL